MIYRDHEDSPRQGRARLVVVQHSRDCDQSPLYMVAEKPIIPPDKRFRCYSQGYLAYRLHAGWFEGNVAIDRLKDTGERVELERFDVESFQNCPPA